MTVELLDNLTFDRLASRTMLEQTSVEAARRVLVDGQRQADVCRDMGVFPQQLSRVIKRLEREYTDNVPALTGDSPLAVSRALAVAKLRELKGDEAILKIPRPDDLLIGTVVVRADHHLVQAIGKNHYMLHELSRLERVPRVGSSVELKYKDGMAKVVDSGRELDRQRGGRGR